MGIKSGTSREHRELVGRLVRQVWVEWAGEQPEPKPSWLLPWEDLDDGDREVDTRIGAALFRSGHAAAWEELVAAQPRVFRDGEVVPARVCVLYRNGLVAYLDDTSECGCADDPLNECACSYPVTNGNLGPLVEVILPDYAAVVDADLTERLLSTPKGKAEPAPSGKDDTPWIKARLTEMRRKRVLEALTRYVNEHGEISDDPDDVSSAASAVWDALGMDPGHG